MRLPEGTVTFLFTDVEGSTRLLESDQQATGVALAKHLGLLKQIVVRHRGVVFETVGDAVYAAFGRPADAVAAALDSQLALAAQDWGPIERLSVRMAIHAGPVVRRARHYFGPALFRTARLQALGFGGQTLLSGLVASLVSEEMPAGATLRSLGSHRLKDLAEPEQVFQLVHPDLRTDFPPLKSIDARPHNLPQQLSSFVGRDRELANLRDLLAQHRLVTLVGEGGIGKTRLALQAAADHLDLFEHGVFIVDLAVVDDPELIPGAIAGTLGLREQTGQPISTTIGDYLRERSVLLVLDNLEHLLPAAAASVAEVLRGCPRLHVIATSRAPLRVAGERQFRVSPLAAGDAQLPDATVPPAVALFVDRAQAVDPGFVLDDESGPLIADICQRLDGLPLAIELAVQRLSVFGLTQLRTRLSRRLDVLARGTRDSPRRQQTLRNAIAWSVDLLSPSERALFRRLGVFVGPFSLDAVDAVAGPDAAGDPVEMLESLVDNSLVRRVEAPGEARFAMLETVREHAAELLTASGDTDEALDRSIEFWAGAAEAFLTAILSPRLVGGRRRDGVEDAVASMVLDLPNGRAALQAAIARQRQAEALRITSGLSIIWIDRGPWREGLELSEAALEIGELPVSPLASDVLHRTAIIAQRLGNHRSARRLWTRALEMRRALGDLDRIESTLTNLTAVAETPTEALGYIEECLVIKRRLGTELHDSLADLAGVRLELDDLEGAEPILEEALGAARAVGDHGMASAIDYAIGRIAHHRGDHAAARGRFERAVHEAHAARAPFPAAAASAGIAECDVADGRRIAAAERLAAALASAPEDEWDLHPEHVTEVLFAMATFARSAGDSLTATEICGALARSRGRMSGGLQLAFRQRELSAVAAAALEDLGHDEFWPAWRRGWESWPDGQSSLARRALGGRARVEGDPTDEERTGTS